MEWIFDLYRSTEIVSSYTGINSPSFVTITPGMAMLSSCLVEANVSAMSALAHGPAGSKSSRLRSTSLPTLCDDLYLFFIWRLMEFLIESVIPNALSW